MGLGAGGGGGECSLEVVAWELGRLSESLSSNGGPTSGSGIIACSWCAKLKFSWFASAEQNFWLARRYWRTCWSVICAFLTHTKTPRAKGCHKTETCPVVADKEHEGGFAQYEGGWGEEEVLENRHWGEDYAEISLAKDWGISCCSSQRVEGHGRGASRGGGRYIKRSRRKRRRIGVGKTNIR